MTFHRYYCDLKSRVAPFRTAEDFETIKTVASIDALADRADVIHRGNVPGWRFDRPEGLDEENLMRRAFLHLEALERGEVPLRGKFTEPGISLADHTFVVEVDRVHLFYNRGRIGYDWPERMADTLGHAVSTDLIHWEIRRPCLSVQKGGPDSYSVWSPSLLLDKGRYFMYYTGVNFEIAQTICMATSTDLQSWERWPDNPVFVPGTWFDWREDRWSDCRDPMVFLDDDGQYYLYVCTRWKDEAGQLHAAIGVASSRDRIHWEEAGIIRLPGCTECAESPFVMKRQGRYYLFYTNCGKGSAYAVSDNPISGWREKGLLLGAEDHSGDNAHVPSCSEVFAFRGKWYFSFCERLPGNEQYLELKELFWEEDGSVRLGTAVD